MVSAVGTDETIVFPSRSSKAGPPRLFPNAQNVSMHPLKTASGAETDAATLSALFFSTRAP
jgi:hypothetical protein